MFEKAQSPAFWLGILGAIKLFLDTLGFKVVEDSQVDAIANGLAMVFALIGVYASHKKPPAQQPDETQQP